MASRSPNFFHRFAALIRLCLWLIILVGVAAGVRSASVRWNQEMENRRVEVALDYAELRSLALTEGVPVPEVLKRFKAAGANSVAIQEDTLGGLEESRHITLAPGSGATESHITLFAEPREQDILSRRIVSALSEKTYFGVEETAPSGVETLVVRQPWSAIRSVGLGLDSQTVDLARGAGFGIVGRIGNWNGVKPRGLVWSLGELKKQGVSTVLFSGDEVLGYKGYVTAPKNAGLLPSPQSTDEALRSLDLYYGAIEFGKQKGDGQLAKAAPDRVVRVHTIPGSEMLTATVPDAVQRFSLAARERNIRLLFVRLFPDEPNALEFNTDYVAKIVRALDRGSLQTGTAHEYADFSVRPLYRLLIGLAIGAAFLLLTDAVTGVLTGGIGGLLGFVCLLVSVGLVLLAASPVLIGIKLAAFAAALIFPSLGLLLNDLLDKETPFPAIARFLFACLVTLFGVACVVGLLAGNAFLVKADAFVGVKATLGIPLLLVAVVYALDLRARPERSFLRAIRETLQQFVRVSRQPLLLWQIVAATVALVLVFVILSRSGNESAVGVSDLELRIRAVLDRVFLARPRFKDVFGHAAMVLSLLLYTRTRQRLWALPLFIVGIFGQASLLNTFCHLHTPLAVSLWRAFLGIALGLLLGTVAYAVLNRLVLRRFTPTPSGVKP